MTIIKAKGGFVIRWHKSYFSFFVDHDRTSWSTYLGQAHKFSTRMAAEETVIDIRRRASLRSKERKAEKAGKL